MRDFHLTNSARVILRVEDRLEVVVTQAVALAKVMFAVIARLGGAIGALYCAAAWFALTAFGIKHVNGLSFAALRTGF